MLGDYFSLSIKNLKHRGIRSWLTLLGIFIGIAAVVALKEAHQVAAIRNKSKKL